MEILTNVRPVFAVPSWLWEPSMAAKSVRSMLIIRKRYFAGSKKMASSYWLKALHFNPTFPEQALRLASAKCQTMYRLAADA